MICKVVSTIENYNMFGNCSSVVVAFSGGADSIVLLSILNSIKSRYGIKIIAAHVNHCLRGDESDRDELLVRDFCEKNSIELRVLKKEIKEMARESGLGVEECGRQVRYEFFSSICPDALIATAHTLNDRVETMLFNLTRGSTLKGLCSIPAVRGNIIRPLIDCTREEIEEYCLQNNLTFVTDSTNADTFYARNRIRHNVIPELKRINPSIEMSVQRCLSSLIEDEDYLCKTANDLLLFSKKDNGYDVNSLKNAHPSIRKRALTELIQNISGSSPLNQHVEAADKLLFTGGKAQVITGLTVEVKGDTLSFPQRQAPGEKWFVEAAGNIFNLPVGTVKIEIVNKKIFECTQKINKDILDNCFDYDKITGKLIFRSRIDGDFVMLRGRGCTKTVKKLYNERHIPVNLRNDIVVIADDSGILWIEGFGCAERCKICEETERILIVDIGRTFDA